jgi:hypothetical protein
MNIKPAAVIFAKFYDIKFHKNTFSGSIFIGVQQDGLLHRDGNAPNRPVLYKRPAFTSSNCYNSMSKYTPSNTTNTNTSLRCKRQHVSALSSHHQTNLIYVSLVHKVYVHVMGYRLVYIFIIAK